MTNPSIILDDQLMVTAMHRYCLGRKTYMADSCIKWLKTYWSDIDNTTKFVVMKDTAKFVRDITDEYYTEGSWREFLQWTLGNTDQEVVTDVLREIKRAMRQNTKEQSCGESRTLPTFDQCMFICEHNDKFRHKIVVVDGYDIHMFNYMLASYMDFLDPVPGSGLTAEEMRGITFVEDHDGFKLLREPI